MAIGLSIPDQGVTCCFVRWQTVWSIPSLEIVLTHLRRFTHIAVAVITIVSVAAQAAPKPKTANARPTKPRDVGIDIAIVNATAVNLREEPSANAIVLLR